VHYDINDFDETTRGRLDFDVSRLATSLFLAARDSGLSLEDAVRVVLAGVQTYADTVRRLVKKGKGPELDVSESTPPRYPPVDELIHQATQVKRTDFIDKLTRVTNGQRTLVRSLRYFNLPDDERQQALRLLEDYRKRMPKAPAKDFYEVQDVCGRVSG